MRRALLALVSFLVVAGILLTVFSKIAPQGVETYLEKALGKEVRLGRFAYRFPLDIELHDLSIIEKNQFSGEISLQAERLRLGFYPRSFLMRGFFLTHVDLIRPRVVIRKYDNRFFHVFSDLPAEPRLVAVRSLRLIEGAIKWIDYDISKEGFVIEAHELNAEVENMDARDPKRPASYSMAGWISQGRRQQAAEFNLEGRTALSNGNTSLSLACEEVWLPHFRPYYEKLTSAQIEDGFLHMTSTTELEEGHWGTHARLTLRRLRFSGFEPGEQLWGVDADSVLNLIRIGEGVLPLDLAIETSLDRPDLSVAGVLKDSLQRSMRTLLVASVQTAVEETVTSASDTSEGDTGKDETQTSTDKVQKVLEW